MPMISKDKIHMNKFTCMCVLFLHVVYHAKCILILDWKMQNSVQFISSGKCKFSFFSSLTFHDCPCWKLQFVLHLFKMYYKGNEHLIDSTICSCTQLQTFIEIFCGDTKLVIVEPSWIHVRFIKFYTKSYTSLKNDQWVVKNLQLASW